MPDLPGMVALRKSWKLTFEYLANLPDLNDATFKSNKANRAKC